VKKASAGKKHSKSSPPKGGKSVSKSASKSRRAGGSGSVDKMKAVLLERREDLLEGVEHNLQHQSSPSSTKGDSSDLAADALDSDTAMQLAESGSSELAQIDEALRKIDENTYGECEVCSENIPWGRLEAVPYATLCVGCKEQQERSGEGGSDASGWGAVDEFDTLERDM
jgi:DnaK suppressor protein